MILLPDIVKIDGTNTEYIQSDRDYTRRAYGLLRSAALQQYRKNQDVLDFVIYQFKRCDLRFDPKKFDSIESYRNKVVRDYVYKKVVAALRKANGKWCESLPANVKYNEFNDVSADCVALLNKANLSQREKDIIYQLYYMNEKPKDVAAKYKTSVWHMNKEHAAILDKLREVKYASNRTDSDM